MMKEEKEFNKINVFGKGNPNDAFAKYFIGQSYLNPLVDQNSPLFLAKRLSNERWLEILSDSFLSFKSSLDSLIYSPTL